LGALRRAGAREGREGRFIPSRASSALAVLLAMSHAATPDAEAQWISPPGQGWLDITLIHHDTKREFDPLGSARDLFAGGHAVTRSAFLTGNLGIVEGVDIWAQLPFHHLRFDDAGGERTSSGVGDPKAWIRIGPDLLGLPTWPVALRGGVKFDSGTFELDAEVIPLGEGQNDLELLFEVGRSFHPRPFWTMGWIGYRWRFANTSASTRPGDETFWWWAVGGEVKGLGWQTALEGLSGQPWIIQNLSIRSARRSMHQVFGKVDYPLGPGRLQLGFRAPLAGRNLPAGWAVTSGYFLRSGS